MNGTTLCPHCETRFKITHVQLTAHEGRVRCGKCLEAFDARPRFIPDQVSPQLDLPIEEIEETDAITDDSQINDGQEEPAEEQTNEYGEEINERVPVFHVKNQVEEPLAMPIDDFSLDTSELTPTHSELTIPAESEDALDFSQMATPQPKSKQSEFTQAINFEKLHETADTSSDEYLTSFEIPGKRPVWPWVRGAFIACIVLLLQVAYFYRTPLAAHFPTLKPILVTSCHAFNCDVALPQQANLMSIESSNLEADAKNENKINFSALLRNRANYPQAFPILSLTLSDEQNRPLARRLLQAQDYLPATENLKAGFPANHEINILLHLQATHFRPAGYQLELYYKPL
ncbi:MAG: zinc-ribbon and DUF3426 domain-containing protein [Gallionella sp.]